MIKIFFCDAIMHQEEKLAPAERNVSAGKRMPTHFLIVMAEGEFVAARINRKPDVGPFNQPIFRRLQLLWI